MPLADGSAVPVKVMRRRQRRIILHAEADDGSFWLSAPVGTSDAVLRSFLRGEGAAWISARQADFQKRAAKATVRCRGCECPVIWVAGPCRFAYTEGVFRITAPSYAQAEKMFRRWWLGEALACYDQHVDAWMPLFELEHVPRPLVRVRRLKRAWGICYQNPGRVHFSDRLFAAPDELVDYVVLHELTHLIYPDHGPGFQAFLTRWMPDRRRRELELKALLPLISPLWPPQPHGS